MHTPGHAVVNAAALAPLFGTPVGPYLVAGAVLPDVPIVLLWALHRRRGVPDDVIWRVHYQEPLWLNLIHGLHSFVLGGAGLAASLALGSPAAAAFFASLLLHAGLDFPVHGIDAHRHLFPVSNWRFVSPVSYWDVGRHARVVGVAELALVLACAGVLWARGLDTSGKVALAAVLVWYPLNYWRAIWRARPPAVTG